LAATASNQQSQNAAKSVFRRRLEVEGLAGFIAKTLENTGWKKLTEEGQMRKIPWVSCMIHERLLGA
jgi:hypothetical protein